MYMLDLTAQECKQRLRQEFYKNSNIRDPRVIDMLVIKVGMTYVGYTCIVQPKKHKHVLHSNKLVALM